MTATQAGERTQNIDAILNHRDKLMREKSMLTIALEGLLVATLQIESDEAHEARKSARSALLISREERA